MNRGLYTAMTSMVNNQKRMDVLSNNLANVNTTGYKKDYSISESFPEKLFAKRNRVNEPNRVAPLDNVTMQRDGDVYRARVKEGFFRVETPTGISHVKEISFVEDEGYLKTSYKRFNDQRTTLGENYILDRTGNRIAAGNMNENIMENLVYNPKGYVIGTMSGGVKFKRSFADFTQGGIVDTGNKLDVALLGPGFFKLQGQEGVLYTRDGNFSLNGQNQLVDMDGKAVLSNNNTPITLPNGDINISENGVISVDGQMIATLGIENITNTEALKKVGDNNYQGIVQNNEPIPLQIEAFQGRTMQGHVESSNMNPIDGMVEMIKLLREFEASQKVIRMEDEMLEKAATEIAKL